MWGLGCAEMSTRCLVNQTPRYVVASHLRQVELLDHGITLARLSPMVWRRPSVFRH